MLRRTHLINEITTSPVNMHLLYGPSGFGKSVLLHQLAGSLDETVYIEATRTVALTTAVLDALSRESGQAPEYRDVQRALVETGRLRPGTTILISQAYVWSDAQLSELLLLARVTRDVRWVVELRSINIPGFHTALITQQVRGHGPMQLRISWDDLKAWQPSLTESDAETLHPFEGWPLAASGYTENFFNPGRLFSDLVATLPPEDRAQLLHLRTTLDWTTLRQQDPDLGERLIRAGMPIYESRALFVPQTAFLTWIAHSSHGETMGGFDEVYVEILDLLRDSPRKLARAMRVAEENIRWDELRREQRDHILDLFAEVRADELTPVLRDRLADTAERRGRLDLTRLLVAMQEAGGHATHMTYDTVMRMLLRRNDRLGEFAQYLARAGQVAETPHEHFRTTVLEAQWSVVQLDGEGVLAAAKRMVQYTESRLDRILQAYEYEIQAYIMLNDAESVERAYRDIEALGHLSNDMAALKHIKVLMADFLKDVGRYEEAAEMLQTAFPAGAAERGKNSDYAEVQKAMVLMETGNYQQAIWHCIQALAAFEQNKQFVGIIMPLTFQVFCLFRLGEGKHDVGQMNDVTNILKRYVRMYWSDNPPGSTEAASFYPLAEGALLLAQGQFEEGIERLEWIRTEGAEWYDSVLLAWLLACQQRFELGTLTEAHLGRLLYLSAQRAGRNDETLRMYVRRHHMPMFQFAAEQGWHAERIKNLTQDQARQDVMEIRLLSDPPNVVFNGTPQGYERGTVMLMAYLAERKPGQKLTADELRREVYGAGWKMTTVTTQLSRFRSRLKATWPHLVPALMGRSLADCEVHVRLDYHQTFSLSAEPLASELERLAPLATLDTYGGEWIVGMVSTLVRSASRAVAEVQNSGASLKAVIELRLLLLKLAPDDVENREALLALAPTSNLPWLTNLLNPSISDDAPVGVMVDVALRVLRSEGSPGRPLVGRN